MVISVLPTARTSATSSACPARRRCDAAPHSWYGATIHDHNGPWRNHRAIGNEGVWCTSCLRCSTNPPSSSQRVRLFVADQKCGVSCLPLFPFWAGPPLRRWHPPAICVCVSAYGGRTARSALFCVLERPALSACLCAPRRAENPQSLFSPLRTDHTAKLQPMHIIRKG